VKPEIASNFEQVAGSYDSTEAIFSGPIADRLVEVARIGPGDRVLDVGCGTGAALLRAAVAVVPGGRVTGVDLSDRMLDVARARAAVAGLDNVTLMPGDAEDPPGADDTFDAVISSLVFYLLPHPEQAARRWLPLLRPGGMIAFSWNVAEDPDWVPVLAAADSYVPPGLPRFVEMLRHWPLGSVPELEETLAGCGYTDISTVTDGVPSRYPSPADWWDSGWTRARRISWQHIPSDRLPTARADVLNLLDRLRDPDDGSVTRTATFGWTTARRPVLRSRPVG
jgi:ubiquinone/menaquinone biosynthesis C-methylase UbiE